MKKKATNLTKLKEAQGILSLITKYIDRDAFIAGGFSAEMYLGTNYDTDIDIFFKSPSFPLDEWSSCHDSLEFVLNQSDYKFSIAKLEIYYYHYSIRRLMSVKKNGVSFDLIQYDENLNRKQLLDTFDLDECKAFSYFHNSGLFGDNLITVASDEFVEAWSSTEINPHYDMFKKEEVNKLQNDKTKNRAEKWKERKKVYFEQMKF